MKIYEINKEWLENELEEIKHKPLCYDTVEWYSVLLSLKHRLEEREEQRAEHHGSAHHDASSEAYHALTRHEAREWTSKMRNADGSKGEHWTMDQARSVYDKLELKCDPAEFYAIINALYSDYSEVMKSEGITDKDVDFWGKFAAAWLHDSDAMPHKAMRYYRCIANK